MLSREQFLKLFFVSGLGILLILLVVMLMKREAPVNLPPLESYGQDLAPEAKARLIARIADYEQKAKDNPKDGDTWLQLGINQNTLGATPYALISYKKSAQINPKSFLPFLNLGNIYVKMGAYSDAERAYFTALQDDPIKVYLYRPMVELYEQHLTQKKYKVPELLNAGLKQEALLENQELLGMLAVYYKDAGDRANAIPVYERLVRADPTNDTAKRELEELKKK